MDTHVRVIGWLWIVMGVLGILAAICAVTIILGFGQVPNPRDANIATAAVLCVLIPGGILDLITGFGLLKFKAWARILSILFGILNLFNFPLGTAIGVYTLVIMFNKEAEPLFEGGA